MNISMSKNTGAIDITKVS